MGISEKTLRVGVCDACARTVMQDQKGVVPGYVGEVQDTRGGHPIEFFACSLPHIGKAVAKLLAGREPKKRTKVQIVEQPASPVKEGEGTWTDPHDASIFNGMQASYNNQ